MNIQRKSPIFVLCIAAWLCSLLALLASVIRYQETVLMALGFKIAVPIITFLIATVLLIYLFAYYKKRCLYKFVGILFLLYGISLLFILFRDISFTLEDVSVDMYVLRFEHFTNLIPFKMLADIGNYTSMTDFIINVVGNLVLFVPYGCMLPIVWKQAQNTKFFAIFTLILLFMVEIIQFVTMSGVCDVDDIICNYIGAWVAYLCSKYFVKKIEGKHL